MHNHLLKTPTSDVGVFCWSPTGVKWHILYMKRYGPYCFVTPFLNYSISSSLKPPYSGELTIFALYINL